MSLIFVFFLNLLFFNGCLTANTNRESKQQNNNKITTKSSAFNEDFQYAIFDNADLIELLQLAKDPRVSEFVKKHIFPVKYHNYMINIFTNNDEDHPEGKVDELEKSIYIYGYNFYLDIIKHFGASIQKLSIHRSDELSDNRSAVLYQYINEYCSESLYLLYLGFIKENGFAWFKKPFPKLMDFSIYIETNRIGSLQFLNETFPKLQKLRLSFFDSTNEHECNGTRFIESDVPHMDNLQHIGIFTIVKYPADYLIVQKQLENIFRKNQQIRSLAHKTPLGDFIQIIDKYLPNLQHFTITSLESGIQPVHFDHVKNFSVRIDVPSCYERLSFAHLDAIDMFYSLALRTGSARNSWTTFFRNHQNLRILSCTLYDDDGFVELLNELQNLNEIRIRFYPRFDIDMIGRLIENHRNLLKLQYQVNTFYHPNDSLDIYRERFDSQWNITHFIQGEWSTLSFERDHLMASNELM